MGHSFAFTLKTKDLSINVEDKIEVDAGNI